MKEDRIAFIVSPHGELLARTPAVEFADPVRSVESPSEDRGLRRFAEGLQSSFGTDLTERLFGRLEQFALYGPDGQSLGTLCVDRPGKPAPGHDAPAESPGRMAEQVAIFALSMAAEWRDRFCGKHFRRIRSMARLIAFNLRQNERYRSILTDDYLVALFNAALIHDIGKLAIPDSILKSTGRLSDREMAIMRKHPEIGAHILHEIGALLGPSLFLDLAHEVVLYHHEAMDGSGYPRGLKGDAIPLSARIVCLCDVYDALREERHYKRGFTHEEALVIIRKDTGTKFCPDVVAAFMAVESEIADLQDVWNATDDAYSEILQPFHQKVDELIQSSGGATDA